MIPPRGKNREEPIMTKILQVCQAQLLAPGACPFRYADAVFLDEFPVDDLSVLAPWNPPRHIEPVTMTQVGASDLLDEAGDGNNFGTILHVPHQS